MIATLTGCLRRRADDRVVLECGGIGYEVFLPPIALRALEGWPEPDPEPAETRELPQPS